MATLNYKPLKLHDMCNRLQLQNGSIVTISMRTQVNASNRSADTLRQQENRDFLDMSVDYIT